MQPILSQNNLNKKFILQFLPKQYEYLTTTKKLEFNVLINKKRGIPTEKKVRLKSAYLIDLMHKIIFGYYRKTVGEQKETYIINLSSEILRVLYGTHYNYYIDYLVSIGFMKMKYNYCQGKRTTGYEININSFKGQDKTVRYENKDVFVLKKWKESLKMNTMEKISDPLNFQEKGLYSSIKRKLANDLEHVTIDLKAAQDYLHTLREQEIISMEAYIKNEMSLYQIDAQSFFFTEDKFGRFHTNFTNLKKAIRSKFLKIDGQSVAETDLKNSHPRFLALFLKEDNFDKKYPNEYLRYLDKVRQGLIYEEIMESTKNESRDFAKKLIYKVFFGKNYAMCKYNLTFRKLYPNIWNWIVEYKAKHNNSKILSWELQRRESVLIFDLICAKIKRQIPQIHIFTVHDSIYYPESFKDEVENIFFKEVDIALG